ncbi:hypothetical protein [Bacillus sp. AFS031507]|uniref:hypothetical protein n=1 Tax=Bacillus sp. AFS031507 TaxID=2033496 RepID=UPI000BFB2258|nr:hypothetical protein [Bacillus sp. AFS031507]PGY06818.1 hypothetical protein COE25_26130 [Bacillus sp. AFS031507]
MKIKVFLILIIVIILFVSPYFFKNAKQNSYKVAVKEYLIKNKKIEAKKIKSIELYSEQTEFEDEFWLVSVKLLDDRGEFNYLVNKKTKKVKFENYILDNLVYDEYDYKLLKKEELNYK